MVIVLLQENLENAEVFTPKLLICEKTITIPLTPNISFELTNMISLGMGEDSNIFLAQ